METKENKNLKDAIDRFKKVFDIDQNKNPFGDILNGFPFPFKDKKDTDKDSHGKI
jgi:hypothetical protein